ncbi:MAG: hypothetical protein ACREE4_03185 [Stellaceae bacterium]
MAVPKQDEVRAILAEFEARIHSIVDRAWREWQEFPLRGRFVFPRRARAVIVFDFIARLAVAEFDGDSNVRVMIKKQTVHFLFRDQVFLRFKKGNEKGIGSNIETQAVLNIIDPQGVIPGLIPEIMKVEIVYTPDNIGVALQEVAVVARNIQTRIWSYPLDIPSGTVEPFPTPPPDVTPPHVVPRYPTPEEKPSDHE